jgi:hypothetical protein
MNHPPLMPALNFGSLYIVQPGATVPTLGSARALAQAVAESSPTGPSKRGSHRLGTIDRCAQDWRLRYHENLVLAQDKPYRMRGTLWHMCAAYYEVSRMEPSRRPAWYYAKELYAALKELGVGHEGMVEHLYRQVLPRYIDWSDRRYKASGMVPFAVEHEFSARVGDLDPGGPWPELDDEVVTCAPDLVLTDGVYLNIDDYKTKARSYRKDKLLSAFKALGNEFFPSPQVNTNLAIVRAAHPEFLTTAFSIVRVLVVDPFDMDRNQVMVPELPYQNTGRIIRARVRRELALARLFEERAAAGGSFLAGGLDDRGDSLENYDACHWGKYGACDYLDICTAPDEETRRRVVHDKFVQRVTTKEYEDDDEPAAA